jgi:hypothetical protein
LSLGQRTLPRDADPSWEADRGRREFRDHDESTMVLRLAAAELLGYRAERSERGRLAEPQDRGTPDPDER